jgi:hypothetical protein
MSIRVTLSRYAVWLVAVGTLLFASVPARADLIVAAGSTTVAPGSTGNTVDVTLMNTGPAAVTVGGFSFGLSTGSAGISFTQANISTAAAPYVFAGHSAFGPIISTSIGASLGASDLYDIAGMGVTVGAGQTVGLGHVLFDVAPGTPGGAVTLTVLPFPTTSLSDPAGNNIPITSLANGTITVTGLPTAVPEPTALLLAGLGWPAAWLLRRRRAA